jgi:Cof subfamily protein (haloacid dehalogenase superfamily)
MIPIKLVALDLDGTTLNSQGKLSSEMKATLEEAISKGIHIIFATGRVFSAISQEVLGIQGIRYVLSSNGARVVDLCSGKVIYENYLEPEAVDDMAQLLGQYDFMYEVFTDGQAYVDRKYYDSITSMKLSDRHTTYVLSTRNPVDHVLNHMRDHRTTIENININFNDPQARLRMKEVLSQKTNITLTSSFDHNLEIGGVSTGKGDAVGKVATLLQVKPEEIMAIGDNPNDKSMLMVAGWPVAVANAKDEVKEVAKYITGSNDEGGVGQAIRKWVLDPMKK